jgi:uncharacterized protein YbjT (DUF2867 family)
MILITGATGLVGSELIRRLAGGKHALRALTRRPEALRSTDVEVVRGDFDDPPSLDAALRGVDSVFMMSAQTIGATAGPTHDRAFAAACSRARVRKIVKLSVLDGGGREPSDPIARWHAAAEHAVRESGAAWTLLRPGRFMSNALGWAPMIARGDDVFLAFATRPAASIDPADVAAVAAAALLDDAHAGRSYELSGPECLTPIDELAILARELGRSLRPKLVSLADARAGLLQHGMSEDIVDAVMKQTESDRGTSVLSTVADVIGRPARTFAQWAHAHREAFA